MTTKVVMIPHEAKPVPTVHEQAQLSAHDLRLLSQIEQGLLQAGDIDLRFPPTSGPNGRRRTWLPEINPRILIVALVGFALALVGGVFAAAISMTAPVATPAQASIASPTAPIQGPGLGINPGGQVDLVTTAPVDITLPPAGSAPIDVPVVTVTTVPVVHSVGTGHPVDVTAPAHASTNVPVRVAAPAQTQTGTGTPPGNPPTVFTPQAPPPAAGGTTPPIVNKPATPAANQPASTPKPTAGTGSTSKPVVNKPNTPADNGPAVSFNKTSDAGAGEVGTNHAGTPPTPNATGTGLTEVPATVHD